MTPNDHNLIRCFKMTGAAQAITMVRLSYVFLITAFLLQVGLWIDAGSRYENERNNGTAHFLEHMAFKVRFACVIAPHHLGCKDLQNVQL